MGRKHHASQRRTAPAWCRKSIYGHKADL